MSKYYPHQCPDTGRWFICEQGVDNNLAEVFDHNNVPAVLTAYRMAHCMNQDDVIRAEQKKLVDAVTSATGAPLQAQPKKTGGMRCPGVATCTSRTCGHKKTPHIETESCYDDNYGCPDCVPLETEAAP